MFLFKLALYEAANFLWIKILKQMPISTSYPLAMDNGYDHCRNLQRWHDYLSRAFLRSQGDKGLSDHCPHISTSKIVDNP